MANVKGTCDYTEKQNAHGFISDEKENFLESC